VLIAEFPTTVLRNSKHKPCQMHVGRAVSEGKAVYPHLAWLGSNACTRAPCLCRCLTSAIAPVYSPLAG
jgi:hypothetical protein